MASAPLQPVVAIVQRRPPDAADELAGKSPPVELAFKATSFGPDAQQMRTIVKVRTILASSLMHDTRFFLRTPVLGQDFCL